MDLLRILEPDETGLGRIVFNGRFYGVPVEVLKYIGELGVNAERLAIANKDNADELQERIDFLTDQNKRLFEALWRVASGDIPRNLGARKRCNHGLFDMEDCVYCTEDFAKATLAEVRGDKE